MKKIIYFCILIGFYLVFSESVSYGFALNISAPTLEVSAKPGSSTTGTVTVFNEGTTDIGISAYTQDWLYEPDGTRKFYDAGTTQFSCAKWLRLFPKKFNLEAGKKMGVQYIIDVPEVAEGGYYAVIFFESIPAGEREGKGGVFVRFSGRLGTIVYLETEGKSIHKGSIESLSITPPQSDRPLEMNLLFKNTGNVHLSPPGTLNIIDGEGNIFAKERFGPLNTLPGDTREAKVEWLGELKEGTYYAVVTLDIGTPEPIVEERKFEISFGGTIEDFSIDVSQEKPSFSVLVKNTGHLNIEPIGRVEVLEEDGDVVKILNLEKSLIAPGKEKEFKVSLEEGLSRGSYTAKAIISIGEKELIKEEIFSIK